MHWAYPAWRWGLAIVPCCAIWLWWAISRRRALLRTFAAYPLVDYLTSSVAWGMRLFKNMCLTLGVGCLVLALLGPQWGFHWEEVHHRGVDLVIAVDVSKSMLAEDMKPNRLQRAVLAIQELLPMLQGDRIGLLAFAGTSFLVCPLTNDYSAVELTLQELSPETIPRGGTSLASAIRTSVKAFEASTAESRALVMITDGEDHEGDVEAAAQAAANGGVNIFCLGIGTPSGELIPVTADTGERTFLKDQDGKPVLSRLNESVLQQMAMITGGSYLRATPTAFGLDRLYRERIASMKASAFESTKRKQYELRYQWPLMAGFLLLCLEILISDRKREQTVASEPFASRARPVRAGHM